MKNTPNPKGTKALRGEDLGPWSLASPASPPADFLSLVSLGPELVFMKGAAGSLPCSTAHLVLTTAKQSRVRPLFWMMSLKFKEARELGLKNRAKYPNFKAVEPVL